MSTLQKSHNYKTNCLESRQLWNTKRTPKTCSEPGRGGLALSWTFLNLLVHNKGTSWDLGVSRHQTAELLPLLRGKTKSHLRCSLYSGVSTSVVVRVRVWWTTDVLRFSPSTIEEQRNKANQVSPKLEKVNHPAAEFFICSTVGLVVPTVLLKVVLASQAVFWLVQTQSCARSKFFFEVQTLVSKQNVWNLPKLEPTQSCHHHCTVRYGLLFMSTNGFCDGLLRQFFTGTTVVSLQTCLQTRTRFLEFLAWKQKPDQLRQYGSSYLLRKTSYRNLVYWQQFVVK